MDELKHRAEEKIGALHEAAKVAANSSRTKVQDVFHQTAEAIQRIREAFQELWNHELIAQSRDRAAAWGREAAQRVREGALPLSPVVLYQELVALFKDHMWRRSMIIFVCGAMVGGSAGVIIGLRAATRAPNGPHARALHTQSDQTVILVEDAVSPGAGAGEVLVRVQAFSVCPADRGVLRGRASALRSLLTRSPVTVGRGFAGVVLDVGVGVSELEMGDEVWGCVSEWAGGAASELLVIRSTRVSKRPRSLAADAAASLPYAGALALRALDRLRYSPNNCRGKRVAIVGASSGEGCAILQLLSSWGARCTAATPRALAPALKQMGAHEIVEMEGGAAAAASWLQLEAAAARAGPWDGVLACAGPGAPPQPHPHPTVLLKATAPRSALVELRARPLITDRLPLPLWAVFIASFYTFRALRWMVGLGSHTDWLEERHQLAPGLESLRLLVDAGQLVPVLDKVYLPQDFESALAHACGEEAVGTTVIRFP
ncbi:reticulon-4-interacting protein 1, mitochondrial-like [Aricia agestis]|uniref:reticulon-4-interacting protein 1, mitochondrial-like n=1 Tax=Aricia agestis TaxID=91739 RepID=UPI001C2081A4|nr:reticulon-4-interacting protein 1, mitochondrial-like [Aricia agestis]XP_041972869.1 reticulon-4-interacting protein 1, mitochondrial-like [Aricia agestis]XP_041972876.1 reticulon-4-interacting protein 1, mitochondrial-like [Aricia agestis]XP_041972882.1 reticulon-4-interacting protein 1, mitochondrial-like [Aricia agestis]